MEILKSFYSQKNDKARADVVRLSKKFACWYIVTFDGETWETWAHCPNCKQAVLFVNGKKAEIK